MLPLRLERLTGLVPMVRQHLPCGERIPLHLGEEDVLGQLQRHFALVGRAGEVAQDGAGETLDAELEAELQLFWGYESGHGRAIA